MAIASLAKRSSATARDAFARIAGAVLDVDLPGPGKMAVGEIHEVFWIGPDQWMVCADFGTHETLADSLKKSFGDAASLTEQTDAWAVMEISGPGCEEMFMRLCPVDIAVFETHRATRTAIEHVGCFVTCLEKSGRYRVFAPRSTFRSVWKAVENAGRSVC